MGSNSKETVKNILSNADIGDSKLDLSNSKINEKMIPKNQNQNYNDLSESDIDLQHQQLTQRKRNLTNRIDQLPFSKWHILMIASLGTTWVFDGYEVAMLSLVAIKLEKHFDKTESQIGMVASLYLIGCCTGALLFGFLAQNFGRKKLFSITLIVYIVSVLGATLSFNYYMFIFFRIMTGLAVGGEYTAIFAAVDEFIPPKNRGYTDVVIDGTWHFGSCLASISTIIMFSFWQDSDYSWRILFSLGALGAIFVIFMRKNIPESPRWLLLKRKFRSAQKIIDFIEYQCQNNMLISQKKYETLANVKDNTSSYNDIGYQSNNIQIQQQIDSERNIQQQDDIEIDEQNFSQIQVWEQFKQILYMLFMVYPKRFILGAVLMSCQAFFYQGIFYTFAMNLNTFYGVEDNKTGYYIIPLSVASFMGPVILGKYFDTVGRKKMVLITYLSVCILLSIMAFLFNIDQLPLTSLIILLTIIFIIASPGASSAHLIVSEIFPSEMRSQVLAIFFAVGFGSGGVIAPSIFGLLIEQKSRYYLALGYYLAAGLMFIGGMVGYFLGINSENKSLEDISQYQNFQKSKKSISKK